MSDFASEGGHWYTSDGVPAYTYIDKDGNEQPTTLWQARKYGYFPSYSGVWAIVAAHELEKWKRGKLLEICAENPRRPDEGQQAYNNLIMALYEAEMARPPDLGSHIHGCIELCLKGKPYDVSYADHVEATMKALTDWCGDCNGITEKSASHPLGYGCRVDFHKQGFVTDFKTKEFNEVFCELPTSKKVWPNHFAQLAACRNALGMPNARGSIIYISTLVPGLVHTVEVPEDKLQWGWDAFCAALELWKVMKKYDPCKTNRKELKWAT